MLRNKQHSMIHPVPWPAAGGGDGPAGTAPWKDARAQALADMIDSLDLESFLRDHSYRRRLNDALACFSDEEFDRFERLYTRRFTIN